VTFLHGLRGADVSDDGTGAWQTRLGLKQLLIRRYHDRLLANGIHDFAWEQCWEEYRRMVIEQCLWPIVWHHFDLSPNVW